MTQQQLPDGLRVKFRHERAYHYRWYYRLFGIQDSFSLSPKGGKTIARILDADGRLVAEGVAVCSAKDTFSRPLGRKIALGRALRALDLQRDIEFIEPGEAK